MSARTLEAAEDSLLEVSGLTTRFRTARGTLTAVDGVSLELRPAEILGLVGESGSGKSVTLRSILGLVRPPGSVSGRVSWRGEDLIAMSERRRRGVRGAQIAMIFQEPMTALNPVLPVRVQIEENLKAHTRLDARARSARAVELLELVGIPAAARRLDDYPHQFSGGMRQRAMIAIALASEPRLLLADEPTTALDVTIQDQILKLILDLRARLGMSVILVTHDLGVVAQSCDRMAVMYAGRIVETGPVVDVFARPRHAYTLGLLGLGAARRHGAAAPALGRGHAAGDERHPARLRVPSPLRLRDRGLPGRDPEARGRHPWAEAACFHQDEVLRHEPWAPA